METIQFSKAASWLLKTCTCPPVGTLAGASFIVNVCKHAESPVYAQFSFADLALCPSWCRRPGRCCYVLRVVACWGKPFLGWRCTFSRAKSQLSPTLTCGEKFSKIKCDIWPVWSGRLYVYFNRWCCGSVGITMSAITTNTSFYSYTVIQAPENKGYMIKAPWFLVDVFRCQDICFH